VSKVALRRRLGDYARPFTAAVSRGGRVIVLMYHAVTAHEQDDAAQLTVSRRRFEDQIRWLDELGYPVVSLASAAERLRAGSLASPVVAVTFDDGYRSFYEHALPILTARGYPATMFVVPGAIDGARPLEALPAHLGPLMTWSEARELARHGITVGAHGMTHRKLSGLTAAEALREAVDSKRAIEDHVGLRVDQFCYPYGSFDSFSRETTAMLGDVGYSVVCTSIAGHNRRASDVLRIRRLRVSWVDDSPAEIAKQCAGAYNWYALVQRAQSRRLRRATSRA